MMMMLVGACDKQRSQEEGGQAASLKHERHTCGKMEHKYQYNAETTFSGDYDGDEGLVALDTPIRKML